MCTVLIEPSLSDDLNNELVQTTLWELKSHVVRLHGQKKTDFDICTDQPEHNGMSPGHEHKLINILLFSLIIQIASFKFKLLNGLCRFVKLKQVD